MKSLRSVCFTLMLVGLPPLVSVARNSSGAEIERVYNAVQPATDQHDFATFERTGPNRFERQSFTDGQLVSTRRIQISDDDRTLTEELGQKRTDGTTNLVTSVYGRSSGEGSGLAGTWAFQSRHSANPAQFTATVAGANGLKVVRRNGVTFVATLDNKPVPLTGPGVISGSMIAFRQVDDNTFAETDSGNGAVTASFTWTISPDGKVLTVTGTAAGGNTPTLVYEKQ